MGWQPVERWRSRNQHGIEWGHPGHAQRPGQSFTGVGREADARAFLAAKMAELGSDWQQIS